MRVLVIDDSAAIRSRLVHMLEEMADVQVREADDAASALESIRREQPDVVILDIRLRASSGLDVLQTVKRAPGPPMVIMLTNHSGEHHRRWCHEHGADFFFDKAREFDKVLEVLAAIR